MEQIVDTLEPAYVYFQQLQEVEIRLAEAHQTNRQLTLAITIMALAAAIAIFFLIRYFREKARSTRLTNALLMQSAAALPKFTETIKKLSSKSLKLSSDLYEEFQQAIDQVKTDQKTHLATVVSDADFISRYPYVKDLDLLSPQEKLVTIFYEEGFKTAEISTLLGVSTNTVRAIKARIKSKLTQSGSVSPSIKKLTILKVN